MKKQSAKTREMENRYFYDSLFPNRINTAQLAITWYKRLLREFGWTYQKNDNGWEKTNNPLVPKSLAEVYLQ
jgi:hypothetical protein